MFNKLISHIFFETIPENIFPVLSFCNISITFLKHNALKYLKLLIIKLLTQLFTLIKKVVLSS